MRTKWVCQPAGYDYEHVYLKYLGFGPSNLIQLKELEIIQAVRNSLFGYPLRS